MSGKCFCNPAKDLDKSGKRLNHCEGVDQTCPVQELDMSGKGYWNLAIYLYKFGVLRNLEGTGHARFYFLESG
jgi:hypothetical protein